jgi:hypothetical protein
MNEIKKIWDCTDHYVNFPKKIKVIYKKIYIKNLNNYNLWIDNLSNKFLSDYNWWLTTVASRDERVTNIYHYICVTLVLDKIKNLKLANTIIVDSIIFRNFLIKKYSSYYEIKKKFKLPNLFFIKNFFFFLIQIFTIKTILLFHKKEDSRKVKIMQTFFLDKDTNYNFYGNFTKRYSKKILFFPSFTNISFLNFFSLIFKLKKKFFIFKEYYFSFSDIKNIFFEKFKNKNFSLHIFNFKNFNFFDLILNEIKSERFSRPVIEGYMNYYFFYRLKKKNINPELVVNLFENQIRDKGLNLSINNFFKKTKRIGYSTTSYHPQFFNLYPVHSEYKAKVLPDKIFVTGRLFKKERLKFLKNLPYFIAKDNKFRTVNFINLNKTIDILVLFSGIKKHDSQLVELIKKNYNFFFKNNIHVCLKPHPLLKLKSIFNNIKDFPLFLETEKKASVIISQSKIVITNSFTAGLYESLFRKSVVMLYNQHPLDHIILLKFKNFKNYLNSFEDSKALISKLKYFLNKNITYNKLDIKNLKKIKKDFFYN